MIPESCDALVVGAGPAGSVAAAQLAAAGRDVVLLDRPGPPPGMDEETMVETATGVLARLGILDLARRHGGDGASRHGLVWGTSELVGRETRGLQVERRAFDEALRERARAVRVDGEATSCRGRVVVVATGRSAPASIEAELPATLAFTARIDRPGAGARASVIEAVREGWLWWLALRTGGAAVTLFADREEVRETGREELWRRATGAALGPARGCEALPRQGTDATARLRACEEGDLLAGDAASSLDPLSSQGLEKALASGEHAALCANALLEGRLDTALVRAHHAAWERRLWRAHRAETLAFYRRERRFADAPFWRARHAVRDERLDRPRAALPARFAPHPELEGAPALRRRGASLESVPGWRRRGGDEPLAQIGALPVGALIESCTPSATLEEALARSARHAQLSALSPRAVAWAVHELLDEGLLVESP